MRGDQNPWIIERVERMIDANETPHEAAQRESKEEVNIDVTYLDLVSKSYPSAGGDTAFFKSFSVWLIFLQKELHRMDWRRKVNMPATITCWLKKPM